MTAAAVAELATLALAAIDAWTHRFRFVTGANGPTERLRDAIEKLRETLVEAER